jgi:hypothetical protein
VQWNSHPIDRDRLDHAVDVDEWDPLNQRF